MLGLVVALTTQVSAAQASVVRCGQVIRRNTTLTADVGPCPGMGIIIGADNVRLDLGGHSVRGSADGSDDRIGIVLPGRHGVTVIHGTVQGFAAGVAVNGGSGNTLTHLVVRDNIGPALRDADFGDGIVIDGSAANSVTASTIGPNNGPFDGIAIIDAGADSNRIEENVIQGNSVAAPLFPGGPGPYNFDEGVFLTPETIDDTLHANAIVNNVISHNGANGINVFESVQGTAIRGNVVERNGFGSAAALNQGISGLGQEEEGIFFNSGAGTSTVVGNIVRSNADGGIVLAGCCGNPQTEVSVGNRVLNNLVTANKAMNLTPELFDSFAYSDQTPGGCGSDVWRGNVWDAYPGTSLGSFAPDCTTIGGSGPRPGIFSVQAATATPAAAAAEGSGTATPSRRRTR